ncbi:MAG: hypothetical protein HDR74_05280 [Bacteroides sp.]|nr:hypothetical protein [Bacteroides sp.]
MKDKKLWIPILIGAIIILGSFILRFCKQNVSDNISDWASFGAYVGGCFGFISVIIMYMVFREQSKMAYKSQFESVFFDMLRTLREIKNDEVDSLLSNISGKLSCHFKVDFGYNDVPIDDIRGVIKYYISYQEKFHRINHYFRYLYHIIKYIEHDKVLCSKEKCKYISLIQAQCSNVELIMIFFNVIGYNNQQYISWLDKYSFFENMQTDSIFLDHIRILFFPNTINKHPQPPKTSPEEALTEWYDEICTDLDKEQCIDTINRLKERAKDKHKPI